MVKRVKGCYPVNAAIETKVPKDGKMDDSVINNVTGLQKIVGFHLKGQYQRKSNTFPVLKVNYKI